MVELARLEKWLTICFVSIGVVSPAWAQAPLEGVKAKRKPPASGQLAPASGKLGPVSRSLRRLKGNVPKPMFRLAKPSEANQSPAKPPAKPPVIAKPKAPTKRQTAAKQPTPRPVAPKVVDDPQPQKPVVASVNTQCRMALAKISNAQVVTSPQSKDSRCVVPDPVSLGTIDSSPDVGVSASPVLDCEFALNFATFMRDTAQPLAKFHFNTAIENVQTGPGFTCRRRNNLATGKLSEHSFGNAIDIAAFKLANGRKIFVQLASLHDADAAAFQAALRKAACGHFTTVLGPGSNAAHATHLHFDLGRSKGKKNPYRICD